jgi:colanic acid/amylovoran biosynthesis glycosyltransferase
MRLGYLVPEFPSQTHVFFWREVEALRAQGIHVQILSTRAPAPSACRHAFAEEARRSTRYLFPPTPAALVEGVRHIAAAPRVARYLAGLSARSPRERAKHVALAATALELVAVCRELGLDHVHIHSAADAAHLGALAFEWAGIPYSLTLHGDLEVYGQDHARKMKNAAFVSAVTRPLREQIVQQAGVPTERTPVIWMGVDVDRFQPGPPLSGTPLRLVTIARLNRQKGHTFALQAIQKCRSQGIAIEYTIAGAGDFSDQILEEVQARGLGDVVKMPGTLSEDEVLDLLRSSHAFVLPSIGLGEAAPVSVMEAMASGCVVVCSRIGGTPDMIRDGVDGYLVVQQDTDGLADAFLRIARRDERDDQMRLQARAQALAMFDHRAMAARLARALAGDCVGASL